MVGPRERHGDAEEHAVAVQAVYLRRLGHVMREVHEELTHEENVAYVRRRGQDEGHVAVEHAELLEQQVVRDEQHLAGDHHEQQQGVVDLVAGRGSSGSSGSSPPWSL